VVRDVVFGGWECRMCSVWSDRLIDVEDPAGLSDRSSKGEDGFSPRRNEEKTQKRDNMNAVWLEVIRND